MKVDISEHLTFKKIFKITIMPILMMVFTSLYGVVDGVCVSNFCENSASFAGLNLIMPICMIVGGVGFMFGTGGSALCAKYLGEKNPQKANETFTSILICTIIVGIILSVCCFFFIEDLARLMASVTADTTEDMISEATTYGKIMILGETLFMIQGLFHSFFSVAEKPQLSFEFTLFAGIANIVLDILFIAVFKWGVAGAAIATIIGQAIGGIGPLVYFLFVKTNRIKLVLCWPNLKDVFKACFNGMSEFVSNISSSIVSIVFNIQLLKYYGQDGVSAYGAMMYLSFVFISIFFGYTIGVSPCAGYQYGAKNKAELSNIIKKSLFIILFVSLLMFGVGELLAVPLGKLFSSGSESLSNLTSYAMRIFSLSFLLCGFSIYLSSLFTALNDGLISALISILRCLVFQIAFVFILPIFMGANGIWWSIMVAELASAILSFVFLLTKQKKYGYSFTDAVAEITQQVKNRAFYIKRKKK